MTDGVVIFLLLTIIFILVAVYAPEVLLYLTLGFCIIGGILIFIIGIVQFINDPAGFLVSLLYNNPMSTFASTLVNATPNATMISNVGKP
jgi:hypothetical protein